MSIQKWLNKNCQSLKGKRVIVTGATGGLGKEICDYLARLEADITLACRNKELADRLIADLQSKYPQVAVDFVQLDLSNLESVNSCIKSIKKYNRIVIEWKKLV